MAGAEVYEAEGLWWIEAAVFAGFLVVSLIFEIALHAIEHKLKHKGRHGLLAFVQGLKTEVLLYGLLSLLLSMVQPALSNLCIRDPAYSGGGAAQYNTGDATKADKGRHLLASYASSCEKGKVQVLSYKAAHNIHVLIFMVAMSHIFLALLSLALCLLKLKMWKKWADAPKNAFEPLSQKVLRGLGSNRCTHWMRSFFRQYYMGVNKAGFLGVRRFFLEQLMSTASLDQLFNFPFYNFLVFSTEHHMARLVAVDWFVWLIAVVVLLMPLEWQKPALYVWTGLSGVMLMICGAKMQSSVVHMASKAHFQQIDSGDFKDVTQGDVQQPPQQQTAQKEEKNLRHRMKRIQTTKDLFWFHKPRVFIMLYKLAYFQVSFALAYLLYKAVIDKEKTDKLLETNDFFEDVGDSIRKHVPYFSGTGALLVLLGLVLILIVHSSWVILPMYSLCMTTSKSAQKDIKDFLEMLKSHEWVDRPASAYLAHELQRNETMQRLNTNYEGGNGQHHRAVAADAAYTGGADQV